MACLTCIPVCVSVSRDALEHWVTVKLCPELGRNLGDNSTLSLPFWETGSYGGGAFPMFPWRL